MDRIIEGLLGEFAHEFDAASLPKDKQFESFASYLAVRRHYSDSTFDPSILVTGQGNDTGIDGIAIIVNGNLITDPDEIDDLLSINSYLDVTFVFIQASISSMFDGAKLGTFGYGIKDFSEMEAF